MSDEDLKLVDEEWTYAGRRFNGEKVVHQWVDPNDRELIYDTGKTAIGGVYRIGVHREDDSVRAAIKYGVFIGPSNDPRAADWEAQDMQTRRRAARQRAERALAKESRIDEALEPLLEITRALRDRATATALAAHISERIIEEYWRSKA